MDDLDAADKAFLDSFLPEGVVPVGYVGAVVYVDAEGTMCWKRMCNFDAPISSAVGILEMVKMQLLGEVPGIPFGDVD